MNNKNLNIKLRLFVIVFAIYAHLSNAQPMSLDSILNTIKINNSELKIYDDQIKAYNEYAKGARALDPPQIGGGFFMTPYDPLMWQPDIMNNSNGMGSFMISVQQMFINPNKLNANAAYMKSMSGIDSAMQRSMRNEMFSMAKMNYYEWMIMKKKLVVLNESEELLNYLIKSTELKYTYGMDKLNSYYKAKAMLGEMQIMKVMAEQGIKQKMIVLNTLMNRDKNRTFDIDTSYILKNYELKVADSTAIKSRSDYTVLSQNINVLKAKQNYEYSKRLPDFGIKYDHMLAFGTQPQQFSAMAMVTIPITPWSSKMYKSNVTGLGFEIEAGKDKQQSFINQVSGNIENIKVQIKSKRQQIELSEKIIIPSMNKNYETELIAYEQNTEMLFMVLDAWQNLKVSQLMYLDQLMELLALQIQYEKQLEIR
ncbi:MAG: TolC family protein [Bacteroidetes bacterium]|nr:TolC family protein [Bacteroidota bacterium]